MTSIQRQSTTITLVVVHTGVLATSSPENFVAAADEVIEVCAKGKSFLGQLMPDRARFRHIEPRVGGVVHALNLGLSFASSEWVVIGFGDETPTCGWIDSLCAILAVPGSSCIHLFHSEVGSEIPLVVVRRKAFLYGPFNERFACDRLAALHWVFRIFPQQTRRIMSDEGVTRHRCDFIESHPCPPVEAPLIGLMELWHELDPRLRCGLLEQIIAAPNATRQSLFALLDSAQNLTLLQGDPCRSGGAYEAKHFWEFNSTDYIRWEIYQPDEPEIIALLQKVRPSSILELGCGAGRNTRYFASSQRYAGMDISMNLIGRAVERQEPNSVGILCGDITIIPFADACFDLVFADSTVQHVTPEKIQQCVMEIVRVSAEYICLIEYTEEESEDGDWFRQIHMFAHDYRRLFEPYCELVWHADTALRVHPARKEIFLFKKRKES